MPSTDQQARIDVRDEAILMFELDLSTSAGSIDEK
jgi:hypothetical protein